MARRGILGILLGIVVLALLIQLVPYGRNHVNPAVVSEPTWDSPQSRLLAQRACFDCHSNETVWPWYSNLAPVSWLVQRDVDSGRRRLNFSDWSAPRRGTGELARVFAEGRMPPVYYVWMHPTASLTATEAAQLSTALSTLTASIPTAGAVAP